MKKLKSWLNRNLLKFSMWSTDGIQVQVEEDVLIKATAHRYRTKERYEMKGTHLQAKKGFLILWIEDWK